MIYKKYKQHDERDCGAACLATIFSYYGLKLPLAKSKELVKTSLMGTNIYGIVDGARSQGLEAEGYEGSIEELLQGLSSGDFSLPLIAHIVSEEGMEHFVVITNISAKRIKIFDPAKGSRTLSIEYFSKLWTGHIITFKKAEIFSAGNYTKGSFSKFLKILSMQKLLIFKIISASLIITVVSLIGSLAYEVVIDNIISPVSLAETHNEPENKHSHEEQLDLGGLNRIEKFFDKIGNYEKYFSEAKYVFWALIGLYIIQANFQISRGVMLAKISKHIDLSLMGTYIQKIHTLSPAYFHNFKTGEILSRFSDIAEIRNAISGAALALIFDTLSFLGGAVIMWIINRTLFGLMMIVAVIYLAVILLFKPLIEKINMKIMTANAMTTSNFKESIDGIETVRLYNAENYSLDKLSGNIKELTKNIFKGQVTYSVQNASVYLIESLSLILTLWIGSKLVIAGQLTLGFLMTFSTLIGYIIMPIKEIIEMQPTIQKAFVAADRLNDVLDSNDEYSEEASENENLIGSIELKDVSFRYNNDFLTLKGITMSIKQGEKIAVIGESGCGKTTIAKLLMKIYSPESGNISIGNSDIEKIPCKALRRHTVYIPQETFLFSDTIRNNLTLGNKDINVDEIDRACKVSMIYDFIEKLPYGLDTMLDEGGKNLSGGQRQRLAIARALLRKPDILIMDEATGQLDGKTELAVHNAILKECRNMTCIIIAHRLTTLKRCDKIAVIDDGKVCEYGAHKELMQIKGKYYDIWSDYNDI